MVRLKGLVVIGALAVAVSVVAAGPAAAAKGGNSVAAKICQKGGWRTLVPVTGDADAFANQGDCVNDGAQGSTPLGSAGQGACQQIGGSLRHSAHPRGLANTRPTPRPTPQTTRTRSHCRRRVLPTTGASTRPHRVTPTTPTPGS